MAAFINAIAEEGTKAEAIEWLQNVWDENCEMRKQALAQKNIIHDQAVEITRLLSIQERPPDGQSSVQNNLLRTALQEALVAMRLASALPGVADEYDFEPAIQSAMRALHSDE